MRYRNIEDVTVITLTSGRSRLRRSFAVGGDIDPALRAIGASYGASNNLAPTGLRHGRDKSRSDDEHRRCVIMSALYEAERVQGLHG